MLRLIASLICCAGLAPMQAQYAPANAEWNRPVEPFRIVGNLYYVGATNVSAYLISTPDGLILIDTGFRETVPLIEANLKKLGFKFEDIRIILTSHAHYDHVAGVADIKARTKARLLVNPIEAPQFASGDKVDFAFGDRVAFPPVEADATLREREPVRLGGVSVTPLFTPGHTKGCTTWTTTIQDAGRPYKVVFPCSLTAPGYRLIGNAQYPGILQDFEASIVKLRALPCDIYLGGHSWDFDLEGKSKALRNSPASNPFVDPAGYKAYVDRAEAALKKQAADQRAK